MRFNGQVNLRLTIVGALGQFLYFQQILHRPVNGRQYSHVLLANRSVVVVVVVVCSIDFSFEFEFDRNIYLIGLLFLDPTRQKTRHSLAAYLIFRNNKKQLIFKPINERGI